MLRPLASYTRFQAFFAHFALSLCVLMLVFLLIRFLWYPYVLFYELNGITIMLMLAGIDAVLGPLITLIIFNPQKKSLKWDMSLVLLLQISFLLYGVWTAFSARPVYVVYHQAAFSVSTANDILPSSQSKVKLAEFKQLPWLGPKFVSATDKISTEDASLIAVGKAFSAGVEVYPEYLLPLTEKKSEMIEKSLKASDIKLIDDELKQRLLDYENRHRDQKMGWLPLNLKASPHFVGINKDTGSILTLI